MFEICESWGVKFYRVLNFVYPVKFNRVCAGTFMSNFQFYREVILVYPVNFYRLNTTIFPK